MSEKGKFSSNIGFMLAAVGSAIGMGNLWGFPYKMGANGGLPFLIIYLFFVILCGVVIMGAEMTIGRHTGKSPAYAMASLGKKYAFVGWFGVISAVIITAFYSQIVSYAFRYLVGFGLNIFGADSFSGMDGAEFFGAFTSDVTSVILYQAVTLFVCFAIVACGVQNGLEKFNKVGVPALFILLIGISIYNLTLPGAIQGYEFMFTTKGMSMAGTEFDFFKAVRAAAGQMLFSCSLGMGIMITYGSYIPKESNISKSAWVIPAADTIAAILAGLAIFPAVFAQGQTPNAGLGLLFKTMHNTFTSMGNIGNLIGFLFYLLTIFAGVSSVISLMEDVTAHMLDSATEKGKKLNRVRSSLFMTILVFILGLPCAFDKLGNSIFETWPLVGKIGCMMDTYDFISEGIMLPLAACLICIVVAWCTKFDWFDKEIEECGNTFYTKRFFHVCIKYISPVLMAFVLVSLSLSYLGI